MQQSEENQQPSQLTIHQFDGFVYEIRYLNDDFLDSKIEPL